MIKAIVNGSQPYEITDPGNEVQCNGQKADFSAVALPSGAYSVLMDGKSYVAQVVKMDREAKTVTLQIAQGMYEVKLIKVSERKAVEKGEVLIVLE
jgi:hypothetical protein